LFHDYRKQELNFLTNVLFPAMAVIMVMNIVLFLRILNGDFRPSHKAHPLIQEEEDVPKPAKKND
jgi:hypothetical protein